MKPLKIMITSGRSPGGLELIRLLYQFGHKIIVIDSHQFTISHFSKTVEKIYQVPKPKQETKSYIETTKEIIKKESIDILIPCYEETFHISKFKSEFSSLCIVWCADIELLKCLHHKKKFIDLCQSFGMLTPKTAYFDKKECISKERSLNNVILKPAYSRYADSVILNPNKEKIKDLNQHPHNPWLIQEKIEGRHYSTYGLAYGGHLLAQTIYPMEMTSFNICIHFEHTIHEELSEWVKKFVTKTKFTGQIGFDFIINEKGLIYPLECNPRMTSGIHLFRNSMELASLFSIPLRKNIDEDVEIFETVSPERQATFMISFLVFFKIFQPFHFIRNLLSWLKGKDVIFRFSDPFPVLGQFFIFFKVMVLSFLKSVSMTEYTMLDIKYNGDDH
jgi:carbamoylphosphate synthase large subunit